MHNISDPALAPIFDALAGSAADAFPLDARCKLIQKVNNSVLSRAKEHRLFVFDKKGLAVSFLPGCFEEEDRVLAKLVSTLSYSRNFRSYFNDNALRLGQAMAEKMPAGLLKRQWPDWDREKRLAFLKEMASMQSRLFNHDGLQFVSPEIKTTPLSAHTLGAFDAGSWSLSDMVMDKAIYINDPHLENSHPLSVAQTVWHEQAHSLCQQFAAARDNGKLADYNPFCKDAETKRLRLKFHAHSYALFPLTYKADPEERMNLETQAAFTTSWENHSRLLPRMAKFFHR